VPVACVHDEILVECDEDEAEKVEAWLEKAMIDGMDDILNGPDVGGPRVPVKVETQIDKTWAGVAHARGRVASERPRTPAKGKK
jgi:DNA polymerase I-like protein with 3'-5' exonuclease and polymerase domains